MSDEGDSIQVPDGMSDVDFLFSVLSHMEQRFADRDELAPRQAAAIDNAIEAVDDAAVEFLGDEPSIE